MKFRKKFFMPVIAVFAVIMSCKGPAESAKTPSGGGSGTPGSGSSKEVKLTVKAGKNGKVTVKIDGKTTILSAEETENLTIKEGSSVEIIAEGVDKTGQKYLFDKWTSSGSDTDFNSVITNLNEKPLDTRKKVLSKLKKDSEITASFIEAYEVSIANNTESKAKGVLKFQYGKENEVVVASGQPPVKRVVPKGNLTIKAVQDASDGYIPYEWKEKVGTQYEPIADTMYKKSFSVTINSDKDFSVSFVQRYAIDNNGVLSIAHPKNADGNIEPDTEATELIIPATVNGVDVKAIAGNASGKKGVFEGWTKLKKVTFPVTLTTIGARAFAGCTALTDFPKDCSVTTINGNAFDGCTALKTLELPASCTTIQTKAFNNCSALSTVTFNNPNLANVVYGADGAFAGCAEISTVNFKGDGTFSIDSVATATSRRIHMLFPSAKTNLKTVNFADGITAFKGDTPYFEKCSALETVDLGKNNKGFNNGKLPNGIFKGCEALKNVRLRDDIKEIGDSSFYGCAELERISIPKGVTSLLLNAFNGCKGLTEIDLRNVSKIANSNVFSGCSGIKKLIVNRKVEFSIIPKNLSSLTGLTMIEVETAEGVNEEQALAVNLSTLCGNTVQGNITSIVIGKKVAIPTDKAFLSNLKKFTNAELKFSVPSPEWKTALVDEGIDVAKINVQ